MSLSASKTDGLLRLVVAEVMEDVRTQARYRILELFVEDTFYDRLEDVVKHDRQQCDERRGRIT